MPGQIENRSGSPAEVENIEVNSAEVAEDAIAFLDELVEVYEPQNRRHKGRKVIRQRIGGFWSNEPIDTARVIRDKKGNIASAYVTGIIPRGIMSHAQWEASIMVNQSQNGPRLVLDTWVRRPEMTIEGKLKTAVSRQFNRGRPNNARGISHLVFGRDEMVGGAEISHLAAVLDSIKFGLDPRNRLKL